MSAIRIVTDSTADIPQDVRERLNIEIVPLKVLFGEETFLDSVTINSGQFFDKLTSSAVLPTTSQPSPAEFMATYDRILNESPGATIISIHLSSALSGTYQSAVLGHSLLERDGDIVVIDSKSASYGFGMLVVKAAELAAAGMPRDQILEEIETMTREKRLYFLVDTLEYLQKGGRIGKAAALFGSILNIKPILSVDADGEVTAVDKVRGQKKALQRIMDLLAKDFGSDPVDITLAWATSNETALELGEQAKARFQVRSTKHTRIGSVIGTYVGPGTVAIFINR
ncbi:DegV family protein [Paenibacillus spongiae]|uniref:DegV family protein n=1 Tax=Paenibacillus spongiae TaxID=2909671 RepID=A0ABY5S5J4_9BACL|nr:DegV family protein [Paenibacillus spongiae]UVI27825.1 DegV family protein [Paenibacillus spongiae]